MVTEFLITKHRGRQPRPDTSMLIPPCPYYNSFYVAITRGKEDARVFTDSADNLWEQVKSLPVKQTALDYAGGSKEQASSQERGSK